MACCIKAETGTLIFAIINLSVMILSSVASIGMLIYGMVVFFWINASSSRIDYVTLMIGAILGWLAFSLLNLVFASFLLNGSLKKKPEHIMAYFIYGVIILLLTLPIIFCVCVFSEMGAAVNSAVILTYVMYCLILFMLRRTIKSMETLREQYSHKQLVEKC
ncbi:uncharacterized protein LOC126373390 [Pectinophora gossypiella]|uniref:uncharacterized protein LOC126373390 n=1 Tax=Pectinophora gossypiella TaxID=13191 RepID=UPI00214EB2F8|nr:uncharacterized protein LOC126373390 [Pectinophora gossypiella]XP_049875513.1 uncharacterized protein LOC126373390 [Pectinophora gossypiella]